MMLLAFAWDDSSPVIGFLLLLLFSGSALLIRSQPLSKNTNQGHAHNLNESTVSSPSLPTPYTRWNHPNKTWFDKIISFILEYIFPFGNVVYISSPDNERAFLRQLRYRTGFFSLLIHWSTCKIYEKIWIRKWNVYVDSNYAKRERDDNNNDKEKMSLVQGIMHLAFKSNVLSEWDILPPSNPLPHIGKDENFLKKDSTVEVKVTCTSSVFTKDRTSIDNYGGRTNTERLNLEDFITTRHNFPIFIYFHSGGMIMDEANDGMPILLLHELMKSRLSRLTNNTVDKKSDTTKASLDGQLALDPSFLSFSVNYRCAPEHPKTAVLDALSVTSTILDTFKESNIHICGASAGGNLASVVTMECIRRYPGRIKSSVIIDAMLLPKADSMSYHLNCQSAGACPASFVRYCWRKYLGLDSDEDAKLESSSSISSSNSLISLDGNIKQVMKSIYNHDNNNAKEPHPLARLYCPQIDLPDLSMRASLPSSTLDSLIIIHTSSADVLRDDGLDLYKKLTRLSEQTKGGPQQQPLSMNVLHFEGQGNHVFSVLVDRDSTRRMADEWCRFVW